MVDLTSHNQTIMVSFKAPTLATVLTPNIIPIEQLTFTPQPNPNSSGSKLGQLLQRIGKYDYVSELLQDNSGLA